VRAVLAVAAQVVDSGQYPARRVSGALNLLGGIIAERNFRQQSDRTRVNERIRAREVRVIDEEGGQLGVMQPYEAVRMAREKILPFAKSRITENFFINKTRKRTSSAKAAAARS
jgi:hypothetical protein